MSALVRIGLLELAFGTLLGWAVAADIAAPDRVRRIGVVSPRRILQAHLDYIMMGLVLVAVGLAASDLSFWIALMVVAGALLNPTLFLPVAFRESLAEALAYRSLSVCSFLAISIGLVAAAFS
ncbi:hypothetical protein OH799_01210 [Nocardia sp. NBC_00881]|uniref:hypothetical protein n=1 Tax=Nocardia sp. NBC_00881 TaxID=2975995 RepID=UPI0038663B12|nr:hypothetical protein OH799_01210 [Nocardia sp. NBC_00881]